MTDDVDPRHTLRQQCRERRRALSPIERIRGANNLAAQLLALPWLPTTGYVAGYWAMDGEIALHAFQLSLPSTLIYCLPVLQPGKRLAFAPWRVGDPVQANQFGIPEPTFSASSLLEPEQLSLVVMPLVGFATYGHRIGMGGGWYDRSFAFKHESQGLPHLVGAAFDEQQVVDHSPNPWDVRMDAVCTPTRTLIFEHRE